MIKLASEILIAQSARFLFKIKQMNKTDFIQNQYRKPDLMLHCFLHISFNVCQTASTLPFIETARD